jgi:hypothetical protein
MSKEDTFNPELDVVVEDLGRIDGGIGAQIVSYDGGAKKLALVRWSKKGDRAYPLKRVTVAEGVALIDFLVSIKDKLEEHAE